MTRTRRKAAPPKTADERIAAAAECLRLKDVEVVSMEEGVEQLRFSVAGYLLVRRETGRCTTGAREKNRELLAQWLGSRAKTILNGIETAHEAFAGCVIDDAGVDLGAFLPLKIIPREQAIDASVEVFITALEGLGIPQRNVKVTWDTASNWARFRAKLPSGNIVNKTLTAHGSAAANLAGLAHWIMARAAGFERGSESSNLDEVFAGAIVKGATT